MKKLTPKRRDALKSLNALPLGWHGLGGHSAHVHAANVRDGLAVKRRDEFGVWFHITEAGRVALKEPAK